MQAPVVLLHVYVFQSVNSVPLPDIAIVVIARADKSGTTELFTTALSAFNEDWRQSFGAFSTGTWPDPVYNAALFDNIIMISKLITREQFLCIPHGFEM